MARKAARLTPNQLLRRARLERGWTQKDVADRIGAPLDLNVTRWESGSTRPSAYYVQKLCELFGKSASELGILPASEPDTPAGSERASAAVQEQQPFWHVPFKRNPFFTGRADLLTTLHELLQRRQRAVLAQSYALTGLGGIGKTQAAVEYAYRYRDEYTAILWIRATSRETLVADFVNLARLLELPNCDAQNQVAVLAAMSRWLAQNVNWLLIFDNADDLPLAAEFLPPGGRGHLLLTTRSQATGNLAESITVENMGPDEGILLLLRRTKLLARDQALDMLPAEVLAQAGAIIKELNGLPLALDQAGAYIEETGCSLAEYLALYRQRRSALLKRKGTLSLDYPHTVASTWALSFQQVEQANPGAADLLRLLASLDPDAIAETLLVDGAGEVGPVLQAVLLDPLQLHEVIQVLRRYSLVKRDPERKLLNVHSLVQVVLKEQMDQAARRQWEERAVKLLNAAFPDESFPVWERCAACMPHVPPIVNIIDEHRFTFPEASRLLHQAGCYLRARGLYEQGKQIFLRALHLREQELGAEHPETVSVRNDLGELCYYQGEYEQAQAHFQHVLAIREQALGELHPDTATSLNNLAVLYRYQGKYDQAEPLYQRALAIREQILEPGHHDIAESLNNLAMAYRAQEKYAQAEPLYQRALAIRQQALGLEHPSTAQSLDNLAVLYRYQGKYEQAEALQQQALAIFEHILGNEHPDTALALRNLALLYQALRQYEKALALYQQALTIFEQKFSPDHPRLAQLLHNLAWFYVVQGQDNQAKPFYQRALAIREKVLGPEHPDTLQVQTEYHQLRTRLGVPAEER